jgi:hypothetical protein
MRRRFVALHSRMCGCSSWREKRIAVLRVGSIQSAGRMFLREIVEDRADPEHQRAADPRRLAEIEAPDPRPIDDIEEAAPLRHDAGIKRARPRRPDDERDLDILVVPLPDGLAIARLEERPDRFNEDAMGLLPVIARRFSSSKVWERARAGRFRRGTPSARVRGRTLTSMRQGNSVCLKAPGRARWETPIARNRS